MRHPIIRILARRVGTTAAACWLAAAGVSAPAPAQCLPEQVDKIIAADGTANHDFGFDVAMDGDTVAIAAIGDAVNGADSGSVYICVHQPDGSWTQQAKLVPDDGGPSDFFGRSLALDGDTLVVGTNRDGPLGFQSGSAYVFVRTDTVWSQQAKLVPDDGAANDWFGWDVAVSGDTVVVGALRDDDNGMNSGSAYLFERDGSGTWTQQTKLLAADGAPGDSFGHAVGISGGLAAVGAYQDDDGGNDSGSVYVFERAGGAWAQQAKLTAEHPLMGDHFGRFLDMEGETIAVGAPFQHALNYGAVYIYERNPDGSWTEQAKLLAEPPLTQHWLGSAVDIRGDLVIAGGAGSGGPESAVVFIRGRDGAGETTWNLLAELVSSDHAVQDFFGTAVAVGGDIALVGAWRDDDNGSSSGSTYVFDLIAGPAEALDCNGNGVPDCQDVTTQSSADCNGNAIPDECDIAAATSSDCNANGIPDECELFGDTYALDDGTGDTNIGIGGGGQLVWLNQFTVAPRIDEIIEIEIAWGGAFPPGTPATVLVYDDPDNDGDPTDAVLLTAVETVSAGSGAQNVFAPVAIPPTFVGEPGDSFFAGVFVTHLANQWPARIDRTPPSMQRSWSVGSPTSSLDLEDLAGTASSFGLIDSFGLAGNWMVRARASSSSDCNGNETPDDCDIAAGTSPDVNADGVPDECDCFADLDGNAGVGIGDLQALLDAWGSCSGCAADVDDSGSVDAIDLLMLLATWGPCP